VIFLILIKNDGRKIRNSLATPGKLKISGRVNFVEFRFKKNLPTSQPQNSQNWVKAKRILMSF
jgi:hypothetical protein